MQSVPKEMQIYSLMLPTPRGPKTLWVGCSQRRVKMNPTASSQISFSQAEYEKKKKRTRRVVFLEKMDNVVPWSRLMEVIEPHYPKSGKRGRPPIGLQRMLRMYFVQQWYGLADEAVEDAVYDSQALRNFMGIDLSRTNVPDATTLMGFRHLLEAHDLTKAMLVEINVMVGQCLSRRIDNIETVRSEVAAWQSRRDNFQAKVNWQFTTKNARIKLKRLYPTTTS